MSRKYRERVGDKVQIDSVLNSAPDIVDNEPHALAALLHTKSPNTRFTGGLVVSSAGHSGFGE